MRLLAYMSIAAAVLGVSLTAVLVLVAHWGIVGVALGMMIPELVVYNVWVFLAGCRSTHLSVRVAARQTVARWVSAAALFGGVCLAASAVFPAGGWLSFAVETGILALLYLPIGLLVVLPKQESASLFRQILQRVSGKPGAIEESSRVG